MQDTSQIQNYDTIFSSGDFTVETKVNINGVDYGEDKLMSVQTTPTLFKEVPSVGNCTSAEIYMQMLVPSEFIPTMAEIRPFVRLNSSFVPSYIVYNGILSATGSVSGETVIFTSNARVSGQTLVLSTTSVTLTSGWIAQGVFYIDTRERTDYEITPPVLSIHGYDSMLKAEAMYPTDDPGNYPMLDVDVVNFIASAMDIEVDPRTYSIMTDGYTINLPATYSMREVLSNIASMYAANFCISPTGKLRLVGLASIGIETNYLVDQLGQAIVFGSDRILV